MRIDKIEVAQPDIAPLESLQHLCESRSLIGWQGEMDSYMIGHANRSASGAGRCQKSRTIDVWKIRTLFLTCTASIFPSIVLADDGSLAIKQCYRMFALMIIAGEKVPSVLDHIHWCLDHEYMFSGSGASTNGKKTK